MKPHRIVLPLLVLTSLVVGLFAQMPKKSFAATNPLPVGGPAGTSWALTFSDEFDGTALNRTVWRSDLPNGGNGELQEYVNDDSMGNYLVNNGMLQIVARKQDYMGRSYTSGIIYSQYSFRQKYGYFEIRAQVPYGKGYWPAFWMLADPWVPEIDVTEILDDHPNTTYMTLHYSGGQTQSSYIGPDFSAGWHTFAVDWEPSALVWYVDGVERKRVTDTSIIPNVSMWILANLAVGGNWPGNPDSTTVFPGNFNIDYIRAWQKSTSTSPTATPLPASTATPVPTSNSTPVSTANMVQNPSFEDVNASPWNAPWSFRNDLGATFSQDTTTAANGTRASMKAALSSSNSSQPWVVSMTQSNKSLTAGQAYSLSFWAKASASRPIRAIVQDQNSPYAEYTNQAANLTTAWARYSYTFTAPSTTSSAMLNFNLADATGSVWIDEVAICAAGSTCGPTAAPAATAVATATATNTSTPLPSPTASPTSASGGAAPTPPAALLPSDTTPPTVTITSPVSGSLVNRRTIVTITASASDNTGIDRVEFRVNGSLICTDTAAPYSCGWNVPNRRGTTYTIEARAYDPSQNTASSTINLTTSN